MLRRSALVVVMLLVSLVILVMACAPQVGGPTPTTAPTTGAPKAAAPTTAAATAAPKAAAPTTAAATPKPAAAKPQRGGTLTYSLSGEAGELDPHKPTTGPTRRWTRLLYNTLVNTDEKGNIIPELAESWSYPNPNTLVLKLRKGVKFHDGTDFNAQAVKFNIERVLDPATKSARRSVLANIESTEVVNDYEVKLNLKIAQASLVSGLSELWTGGIVSPTGVKKWGDEFGLHPVGTGPFEHVEWVRGDHLTVKRFENYWRKDGEGNQLPYLDGVIIKPIPDATVSLTNLRTGAVDLLESVLPAQLRTVKADTNLKAVDWGNAGLVIYLNCSEPPFDNRALRQAVAWAIDREALHKAIYGGTGVPGQYWLEPNSWAFDPSGSFYTWDLVKAKEKLAEGGKPNGFKFVAKDYNTDLELLVAQAIKGQLAEVGIDMEIVPVDEGKLGDERRTTNFEAIFTKIVGLPADPDDELYSKFHSKSVGDYTKCGSPQVDELLEKARQVYDKAERKVLYSKLQAVILNDSSRIYIHHSNITSAMNQKVMGFTPNISVYYLQLDWIWLKK